jgi:predicted AAA+ superfamily ATPase
MKYIERIFTKNLAKRLHEDLNFIQVVLGPRQVGKTTGLQQIMKRWQGPSLMITADEVAAPTAQWLSMHWEKARQKGKGTLFVIDEVQKIPQWSTIVKHQFDQDRAARHLKGSRKNNFTFLRANSSCLAVLRKLAIS